MDHEDHVDLLRPGVNTPQGKWADFGSGRGAFTLALAYLLYPTGEVHSVDKDRDKLMDQQRRMEERYPEIQVHYHVGDYTQPLGLPPLDGIVIANALHFQRDKSRVLDLLHGYLKPGGTLILVEYNADHGNRWVPHPLSYPSWEKLVEKRGFQETHLLNTKPSSFLGEIYAAASIKEREDEDWIAGS